MMNIDKKFGRNKKCQINSRHSALAGRQLSDLENLLDKRPALSPFQSLGLHDWY